VANNAVRFLRTVVIAAGTLGVLLTLATLWEYQPVHQDWRQVASSMQRLRVLDRHGIALNVTYQNRWNLHDTEALHEIPEFLQQAFIFAEDRRFRSHHGIDWAARAAALWANLRAARTVRGASTLSEQVVRLLHPRPRTLWSRWMEGWEAMALERQLTKADILEFYLNQVPYARQWRGVVQASRGYFNRDLQTLSRKEMLMLAVLVRAPSALDPWKPSALPRLEMAIARLADAMQDAGLLSAQERIQIASETLALEAPSLPLDASHFIQHIRLKEGNAETLRSTLDAHIHTRVRALLEERRKALGHLQVQNAAALVVDHTTGEVLAWAVAGDKHTPGYALDPVLQPRQPGSALKPFLYAAALEKGWTAATLIDDAPLQDAIGSGLHAIRNYSRHYYGAIPLREALGNSLNTPAVRTINFVGVEPYFNLLHRLGFSSLSHNSRRYDVGLALGNGEVTLFELVQAYAALAQGGIFRPLRLRMDASVTPGKQVITSPAASLIGHILSDPYARQREFGASSVLNLPVQTAVKTGTSTDYRDAWAVGYDYRHVVGVWMGNLNQMPMDGVTGASGPALALRAIFAELNRGATTQPLPLDRRLIPQEVCIPDPAPSEANCRPYTEYFLPGRLLANAPDAEISTVAEILRPTENLKLAYDPRIPADLQAFRWEVAGLPEGGEVEWFLNGERVTRTSQKHYLWPVQRGRFELLALLWHPDGQIRKTKPVRFEVK
jgi:penicillin-binding protein 1C